jgi:hypothetical protein
MRERMRERERKREAAKQLEEDLEIKILAIFFLINYYTQHTL